MRGRNVLVVLIGLSVLALMQAPARAAADRAELQRRLEIVEQKLASQGLVELHMQLQSMQSELSQLRGDIEVMRHELEQANKRQRDQYMDIDRRLQRLESGGVTPPVVGGAGDDVVPPIDDAAPPMDGATPDPVPAADPAAEQETYDAALEILKQGRYAEAGKALRGYLAAYPQGRYADNAQYWLAETYYVTRQFDPALKEFGRIAEVYPHSQKLPDARLKMGFIYYEKRDWAAARRELEAVVTLVPGSPAARLAEDRLQRLQKEGH